MTANSKTDIKLTTMTPMSFQILLALADEDRHGYGIIKEIEGRTSGELKPATGTLYVALQRLMDDGYIAESSWRPSDPEEDDGRRRYYRLTERGREAAAREARRLERLIAQARDKRLISDSLAPR